MLAGWRTCSACCASDVAAEHRGWREGRGSESVPHKRGGTEAAGFLEYMFTVNMCVGLGYGKARKDEAV